MDSLLHDISQCTICKSNLPLAPRPVATAHQNSKIIIIGQAPGTKVHESGIPWDDQSGKKLRQWLNVTDEQLLDKMPNVELIILIGAYAQKYYLKDKAKRTLTETVGEYKSYLPEYFPVPHPSPTNRFWRSKNPWFEELVVPELRWIIRDII
ncbi:uracil-DNA glycosylase family protein [uncultured Winogradskyella sp.]|uniref:uracil-DNA glycosylase family protein n=1 Tax=uncultured Winogradskyella sp. TaxID=395353 RepID=UPI0030DDD879|tara:strand:- start:370 stop:825 length:456 start_codon:yes stop_codon:yes gene_type:complete